MLKKFQTKAYVSDILNVITKNKIAFIVLGITSLSILRSLYFKLYRNINKLPPGPIGIPYYGILPSLLINMASQKKFGNKNGNLQKHGEQYGPLSSYWMANNLYILINDSKLCHTILKNRNIIDRPKAWVTDYDPTSDVDDDAFSFRNVNGKDWVKRRKIAQVAIGKLGANKHLDKILGSVMNDTIHPKLNKIINGEKNVKGNEMDKDNKGLWYPRELVNFIAFRTIYHSNFGGIISYEDSLDNSVVAVNKQGLTAKMAIIFTVLKVIKITRYIPFIYNPYKEFVKHRNNCIATIIDKRLNSNDYDVNKPNSYIDYIVKHEKDGKLKRKDVVMDVFLFFVAGIETTSNALEHGLTYLCKDIDVQDRVRQELLSVFKKVNDDGTRVFSLAKWTQCPLLRALIYEILRVSAVVPVGAEHIPIKDTTIDVNGKEYCLPKGAIVQYNTDHIQRYKSDDSWKSVDAHNIHLENWLTKDKNTNEYKFIYNDGLVLFGLGRRDCIGKHLAVKEMAYVLGDLLLNYKFEFNNNENHDEIERIFVGVMYIKNEIGLRVTKVYN